MRVLKGIDPDEYATPETPPQDENLRRLVDCLPNENRQLVELVYFGGMTVPAAAREVHITRPRAERLMAASLETLKRWLDGSLPQPTRDPKLPREGRRVVTVVGCNATTDWGRCHQPAVVDDELCVFHLEALTLGTIPDEDYHRAVVGGREPIQARLSESQMNTLLNGRYRGDGRRLDEYCTYDPLGYEP